MSSKKKRKDFYVYIWWNDETSEVVYVGKGKSKRFKESKDRNPKFKAYINKYKCTPSIVWSNLDEDTAYEKEKYLIALYRKKGMAKLNFHDGGDRPPLKKGAEHPNKREVVQLTLSGEFIKKWDCIANAEKKFSNVKSAISRACRKKVNAYGYLWVYVDEYDPNFNYAYTPKTVAKPILQYTLTGEFVKEWESAKAVNQKHGVSRANLCACLKGNYKSVAGHIWKYKLSEDFPLKIDEVPISETARKNFI